MNQPIDWRTAQRQLNELDARVALSCTCSACGVYHNSEPAPHRIVYDIEEFRMKHLHGSDGVANTMIHVGKRRIPKGLLGTFLDKLWDKLGAPWWIQHPELSPNANIKVSYLASAAFTFTSLNSLASDANLLAGASSLAVDNTSNLYLDSLWSLIVKNNTGVAPTAGKEVDWYMYMAFDDTPTYPDTILGTDAAKTITTSNILQSGITAIGSVVISATTSQLNPLRPRSLSSLTGGIIPSLSGGFVVHNSGQALAATGNTMTRKDVYLTAV